MSVFSPSAAFELFVVAYSRLEGTVLPGSRRLNLGGVPCLEFAGLDGEVTRELLAWGHAPHETLERIRAAAPGLKHWLTVFTRTPEDDLPVFLAAGYQHRESETLLVRRLEEANLPPADPRVTAVTRVEELAAMNAARGYQVFHPAELEDPLTHIFCLMKNDRIAAWGTSLMVRPDVAYFANMYTLPECRRQGFARAILATLLADAAAAGARRGLLVSTRAGHTLYTSAGFQHLLDCLVLVSP
jgi:GNAT superfamily N-acetyltransferase